MHKSYKNNLESIKIEKSPIERFSYSSDASFYRYVPESIIHPASNEEIVKIFDWARLNQKGITIRAAGTSLSGQAVTDSVLVDISRHWNKFWVINDGFEVVSEPGVITKKINDRLKFIGRKLGPDPASINACMIGGIVANNSSGMRSGIDHNPYNTIIELKYILPSGIFVNSADEGSRELLKQKHPKIISGLEQLRSEIHNNNSIYEKIIRKYKIKNTVGYSLNSFIDYSDPLQILSRLMIGSEGTLGFISEVVFRTVAEPKYKITGFVIFYDIYDGCSAIPEIRELGASALEFLDSDSLRISINKLIQITGTPEITEKSFGLLIEFQSDDYEELNLLKQRVQEVLSGYNLIAGSFFSFEKNIQEQIWSIRKGMLPILGATRPPGATLIIEDLAFPLSQLYDAINGIKKLLNKYGYTSTSIYGHGLDGNIHFIMSQTFDSEIEIKRYDDFMNELCEFTTVKLDGSLKAEHGTGRNIAPFVEKEWGSDIYKIMVRIKRLIDPENILNPGVLINADRSIHLKNIKSHPQIDSIVDKCIECGFCESVCPSKDLTLTPRRRIIIQRELMRENNLDDITRRSIRGDFDYYVKDTCAVDGLCAVECPVGINTGELVKELRYESNSRVKNIISILAASKLSWLTCLIKFIIKFSNLFVGIIGVKSFNKFIRLFNGMLKIRLPYWFEYMPLVPDIKPTASENADAIYLPSCPTRLIGKPNKLYQNYESLNNIFLSLAGIAGLHICIPQDFEDLCCGMAFSSKGYKKANRIIIEKTINRLWEYSKHGELPIVLDGSSCAYTLKNLSENLNSEILEQYRQLKILDPVEYLNDYILPGSKIEKIDDGITLHINCSLQKSGLQEKFIELAKQCAKEVYTPENNSCCGFAGDRGFYYPELTECATHDVGQEVATLNAVNCFSTNISCELAMSHATKKQYLSIAYLMYKAMKSK